LNFDFATATEIAFGWGRLSELGQRARAFGTKALLVIGSNPARIEPARAILEAAGISNTVMSVIGEPTTDIAEAGVQLARAAAVDVVVGVGGGSVIDAAKAIAALAPGASPLNDHLEVVGLGKPLLHPSLPLLAVPTTSGTGSEVTRNAVLKVAARQVKVSLRGLTLLPRLALVDPELTVTVPSPVTAATGLDALTQVIEPYVSKARGPLTDGLCVEGIRRAARSIRLACANGTNRRAREDLAITSLFGGLALANAKLGAVHGFAAPLGGRFDAPHGALCARLLPEVMQVNLETARAQANADIVTRFNTIARLLTDSASAVANDGIDWVRALVEELEVPRLQALGVRQADIESLVQQASHASSMKGNPFELTSQQLTRIIESSL
jgi:alcohol dehydrogenase class IV